MGREFVGNLVRPVLRLGGRHAARRFALDDAAFGELLPDGGQKVDDVRLVADDVQDGLLLVLRAVLGDHPLGEGHASVVGFAPLSPQGLLGLGPLGVRPLLHLGDAVADLIRVGAHDDFDLGRG